MKPGAANLSLRAKFILASVVMIVLVTSLMSVFVLYRFRKSLDDEIAKRGQTLARELGARARRPLRAGARERLADLAEAALLREDVVAVEFIDADGESLVKRRAQSPPPPRTRKITHTVARRERPFRDEMDLYAGSAEEEKDGALGAIVLEIGFAATDRVIGGASATIFAVATILALIAIFFSAQFARRITGPIEKLARGVERIGEGSLDIEIEVIDDGEIGMLAQHFNQMAKDLKKSVDQMIQQEKMATLGRMASCISHEIGSPLNSVMFDARIIMEEVSEGPALTSARQIDAQVRRMRDTIKNLLDYARAPSGEMAPVDIERALDEAMLVLALPIRTSGMKITRKFSEDPPPALAIKNLVVQVFVNLINNAIEAAGEDGEIRVEARAAPAAGAGEADMVRVSFIDNGPGIPEDDLETIFEPFYTTRPEGEGTGLGLAICRHIMEVLGGRITADSASGEGSKFHVVFQSIKKKDD